MAATSFELCLKRVEGEDELHERRLLLRSNSTVQIGRASKTEQKKLVPAADNCWIRNPVISRTHAVLSLKEILGTPTIYIEDQNSSHGTYVNGIHIKNIKHSLKSGDKLRFGSEVMRGTETFKPPVFELKITEIGNAPTMANSATEPGLTITFPEDSGEPEREDDVYSEVESDNESQSSVIALDDSPKKTHGSGLFTSPSSGAPGSQANPWSIEADDFETAPVTTHINPEAPPVAVEIVEDTYAEQEEEFGDPYGSDESTDDIEEEEDVDDYMDDNAEPDYFEEEEDISDAEEGGAPSTAQSPIYTPKSPMYSVDSPGYPARPHQLEPSLAPNRDFSPPSFANQNTYWDGPFAYAAGGPPPPPPPPPPGYVSASAVGWDYFADASNRQEWNSPNSIAAPFPPSFQFEPPPPPEPTALPKLVARSPNFSVTTSTRELLDNTRKASGKNEMSIDSLINPPSALSKKRKADQLEEAAPDAAVQDAAVTEVAAPATEPSQAEPIVDGTAAVTRALQDALSSESESSVSPEPVVVAEKLVAPTLTHTSEPPQKRLRTAAAFAAGVLVGGVGMLAGLVSIPEGYLA